MQRPYATEKEKRSKWARDDAFAAGFEAAIAALRRRADQNRLWQITQWDKAADWLETHKPNSP